MMATDEGNRNICDECLFCDQNDVETGERADLQAVLREYFCDEKLQNDADSENEFSYDEDALSDNEDAVRNPSTFIKGYQPFNNQGSVLYNSTREDPDYEVVSKFLERKCKPACQQGPEQMHCSSIFSIAELMQLRRECRALDYHDIHHVNRLDMAIMAQFRALTSVNDETKTSKRAAQSERQRVRTKFLVQGWSVCEKTFLFSFGISNMRYRRVKDIFLKEGMIEKPHGNTKRCTKSILFDYESTVVNFIRSYAEHHAIFLPARPTGHWDTTVKLLPASETKYSIYKNRFAKTLAEQGELPVSGRIFYKLWKKHCPEITVAKPMLRLCKVCQRKFTNPSINTTRTEEQIKNIFQLMTDFLADVRRERELFEATISDMQPNGMHLSFDVPQLVSVPHNTLEDSPLYFVCGFKVAIFGIMNNTVNCQHNFLIPESVSILDESYSINILDYYLNEFATDARNLLLSADNCSWLSKTNSVIRYLCYRIQSGLNDSIQLSFRSAVDTKFSSYWAHGLLKWNYRKSNVDTIQQLVELVEQSTPESRINRSVLVSDEMGTTLKVPFRRWRQYFENMQWKKVPNIAGYAHFKFDKDHSTMVACKKYLHEEGNSIEVGVLRANAGLEEELSWGLSVARQKYLYDHVREFCTQEYKDILCPQPPDIPDSVQETETKVTKPKKRSRSKKSATNDSACFVDVAGDNTVDILEKRMKPEHLESSVDEELSAPVPQPCDGPKVECL